MAVVSLYHTTCPHCGCLVEVPTVYRAARCENCGVGEWLIDAELADATGWWDAQQQDNVDEDALEEDVLLVDGVKAVVDAEPQSATKSSDLGEALAESNSAGVPILRDVGCISFCIDPQWIE